MADSGSMQIFAPIRALDARSLGGPTLEVQVPCGTRLVSEGEPLGTFFVIRAGCAEVWRASVHVRDLQAGECFGEIDPATAMAPDYTVIAGPGLRLLTFSALGISRLCATMPQVGERLRASLPGAGATG